MALKTLHKLHVLAQAVTTGVSNRLRTNDCSTQWILMIVTLLVP